jgi:hypothetical protein
MFRRLGDRFSGRRSGGGSRPGRGLGGSMVCRCPSCGHTQPHSRGTPCTAVSCPKCGTAMRGERC